MHRPLRVPLYLRVWNLIKGILFYNTWNWEKASDGLNLPSLSREEREQKRPKADFEIIKPREKPRAHLDLRRKTKSNEDDYHTQVSEPLPESATDVPQADTKQPASSEGEYVKRRKYKRRRTSSSTGGNGFFRRVFGKE